MTIRVEDFRSGGIHGRQNGNLADKKQDPRRLRPGLAAAGIGCKFPCVDSHSKCEPTPSLLNKLAITYRGEREQQYTPHCFRIPGITAMCQPEREFVTRIWRGQAALSAVNQHAAADRERFSKTKPRRTMIFQRPATTPLTPCLITRVHST